MSRPIIDERITHNLVWETARYVKAIRLRHGLTARAFSDELGFGPALIYRLEREDGGIQLSTLRQILHWHNTHQLPRPCPESTCWLGRGHDGRPHEDHG